MTGPHDIYSPAHCPKEYKLTGIQVGDVGYLTPDNTFIFLFNILLSKHHPINKWRGVPDGFVPFSLEPNKQHQTRYPNDYQPKSVICYTEKGAKSIKANMNVGIP